MFKVANKSANIAFLSSPPSSSRFLFSLPSLSLVWFSSLPGKNTLPLRPRSLKWLQTSLGSFIRLDMYIYVAARATQSNCVPRAPLPGYLVCIPRQCEPWRQNPLRQGVGLKETGLGFSLACVASVSNRVIARKLERKQKKGFFCSCPGFLDEPREETLATQASFSPVEEWNPRGTEKSFTRGGSSPRSKSLPFYLPFLTLLK